jgi:OmpA-OmpF porin, OOP family
MTRNLILGFFLGLSIAATAQKTADKTTMAPVKSGDYKMFAPSDKWEFGINLGGVALQADVPFDWSYGLGLHFRKALDYTFSLRGDVTYQVAKGTTPNATGYEYNGPATKNGNTTDPRRFSSFTSPLISGTMQVVISLNNNRWDAGTRKINPYVFAGAGIGYSNTQVNVISGIATVPGGTLGLQDLQIDGRLIGNIVPVADAGAGIAFRISDKMNIAIEEKISTIFGKRGDLVDGYEFGQRDIYGYTNVRLNFNIGSAANKNQTLPLWWVGPADQVNADIADLKARPKYDPTDTDGDGVVDMLDQEKDTPAGVKVDTRGVALDTDGDGIADYKDKEVFSPAGYTIDKMGIAQVPKPAYVTQPDVEKLIKDKLAAWDASHPATPMATVTTRGVTDWFLPMIHFDFNKSNIKESEFGNLYNVATVMKNNPGIQVLVSGHTDKVSNDSYNQNLSYKRAQNAIDHLVTKYGIDRSRLVLNYSGENTTLVNTSSENYMNRRVEFKVAQGESEMPVPAKEMKKKSYKGNKNAGY